MGDSVSSCYPDRASYGLAKVVDHRPVARSTYRVRLESPAIAQRIQPGQFVMLRLPHTNDPLLGRPLALYDILLDADGQPAALDVVYLVVGKMTCRLTTVPVGSQLEIWGPLGNGFTRRPARHVVMVAGGIGQTPFLTLAKQYLGQAPFAVARAEKPPLPETTPRLTLCYGARSRDYLAGLDDFAALGVEVRIATDDGSAGARGFVTGVLEQLLDEPTAAAPADTLLVACGPEPMLAATARIAAQRGLRCEVSLETPMACGLGICFSCVTPLRDEQGHVDYRRTCIEGPVFDAARVVF